MSLLVVTPPVLTAPAKRAQRHSSGAYSSAMTPPSVTRPPKSLRAGWFAASRFASPADFRRPRHHHDDACIQIVLAGTFRESGWGSGECLPAGMSVLRPAGFEHANPAQERASESLSLQLTGAPPTQCLAGKLAKCDPTRLDDPVLSTLGARVGNELALGDDLSGDAIEGLCIEILVRILRRSRDSRADSAAANAAARCAVIIRARSAEALSVEQLAGELGTNRFALNRSFRHRFGCGVSEYLRAHRVERARREVVGSRRPLVEIALSSGFADQSHMTRAFRHLLGTTPGRLRASARR